MADDVAIRVDSVSKTFKLPHEKHSSIKSAFLGVFKGKRTYEKQQVLKDVSFEIKKGEFFGIVGRNGSGKSTLLKLLAGIYTPDKGAIHVNGKLTPFIELGVGFNPELTGRENVFLNGALLGFNRKEMEAMYDEIVEFAELHKFMDQKLKNYSSGMQVRLAFSIAIRAKSDILVLDEVLAVGDEAFQKKCIDVFESYKKNKQTIVLVTHDMSVVEKYCNRAVLIDKGEILTEGNPRKVAHQYSKMNQERYLNSQTKKSATQNLKDWNIETSVTDINDKTLREFKYGSYVKIGLKWDNPEIKNIGIALLKQSGEYIFGSNTILDEVKIKDNKLSYSVELNIEPGVYQLTIGLFGETEDKPLDFIDDGPKITVTHNGKMKWGGLTKLNHKWQ